MGGKRQINYQFIPTDLFRGCPLIRGFPTYIPWWYIYMSKSDVCFSDAERLGRRMLCKMKGTTVFCWCWPVCSLWWMVGGSSRGGLSSLSSDKASSAIPKSTRRMRTPIHSTTHHPRLTTEKTDNRTTFSGTTPHSAKTSAPISDTDSLP